MGQVRLLPLLAIAAICLLALKTSGLLFSDGYMLTGSAPVRAQDAEPKAQEKEKEAKAEEADTKKPEADEPETAATQETKPKAKTQTAETNAPDSEDVAVMGPGSAPSGAELAILKSLSDRRKTLDKQARDMEMQEKLLKAAEKRVEARIVELKAIEQRIESELKSRDKARDEEYASLVTMYSKMKPKQAARIFNRLDIAVLTNLVRRMKPRTVSPIMAAMDPAVAERVTMELAIRDEQQAPNTDALPKIASETPG